MKAIQKQTWVKVILLSVMLLVIWGIGSGYISYLIKSQDRTLTIGVFSDSYWNVQNGYSYQILDDAIRIFEEENPGIKVKYESGIMKSDYSEWLAEEMLKGTAPDLFFILGEEFNDLAQIGALKNLKDLIDSDSFASDRFYASAYESGRFQNVQYALPYECAPKMMFVNKTILKEEGLSLPDRYWTWEDFYTLCEKVTKDKDGNGTVDQFGVVGYGWREVFEANEVQLFNEKGTECYLTGEKVTESVAFLERLAGLNSGYSVTAKDFDLGKVAFQPMLFSEYRAYKSYPLSIKKYSGFEWECMTMPAGPHGKNKSSLDTLSIGMNAHTVHVEEAWKFMKLLTSDIRIQSEIFDYSEGISVLKEVTESDETMKILDRDSSEYVPMNREILGEVMEQAVVAPGFRNYTSAMEQVGQAVGEILDGAGNISMELIIHNRELNEKLRNVQ